MRYAKHIPKGAKLSWKKTPGRKGFIFWDDRTSGNKSFVPANLSHGRPLWKEILLRIANKLHSLAY